MKKQKTRDKAMLTNKVEGLMSISFLSLGCSPGARAHAYRLKLSDWEISDLAKTNPVGKHADCLFVPNHQSAHAYISIKAMLQYFK